MNRLEELREWCLKEQRRVANPVVDDDSHITLNRMIAKIDELNRPPEPPHNIEKVLALFEKWRQEPDCSPEEAAEYDEMLKELNRRDAPPSEEEDRAAYQAAWDRWWASNTQLTKQDIWNEALAWERGGRK